MKRFLVFGWVKYEANGGLYDLRGDFETLEDAIKESPMYQTEFVLQEYECGQAVEITEEGLKLRAFFLKGSWTELKDE